MHHTNPCTILIHAPYASMHHTHPCTILIHAPYSSMHHMNPCLSYLSNSCTTSMQPNSSSNSQSKVFYFHHIQKFQRLINIFWMWMNGAWPPPSPANEFVFTISRCSVHGSWFQLAGFVEERKARIWRVAMIMITYDKPSHVPQNYLWCRLLLCVTSVYREFKTKKNVHVFDL